MRRSTITVNAGRSDFRRLYNSKIIAKNDDQHYEDLQPTTSQQPVYADLSETPHNNEEHHVYENKTATEPRGRIAYLKSENHETDGGSEAEYEIAKWTVW